MNHKLDIPPPVKKEHKAEYMLESAKLRDAEAWVAKQSETSLVSEESDSATKRYIIIKERETKNKSPLPIIFTLGFMIPCLIWMSLYANLGEPCSVFCSGKEHWNFYEAFIANLYACGVILFLALIDAIGNKKFRSIIFFIGFASGSFIGTMLGGLFV
tara:strand:+ start:239 stop:712 length:474 start_codon:yes stop_codon:yes gene_type:complete